MSDSRLEKFIYAICSMNVSDLPVPLSRIEKLWNCLITGETPDFEPLSRNEKYLMAMLDRYDISNLPAPMSRGEKLLYKIAVGETDLSDVPGYLSRYEELLKYLIENGGIGGGDFEYVLYTLNQSLYTLYTTAEKPVKSAILKGVTYNNVCIDCHLKKEVGSSTGTLAKYNLTMIDKSKNYDVYFDVTDSVNDNVNIKITIQNWSTGISIKNTNGRKKVTINNEQIGDDFKGIAFYFTSHDYNNGAKANVSNIVVVESNNCNLPYFTGMQSVRMPVLTTIGKNLFDIDKFVKSCGGTANGSEYDSTNSINNAIYKIKIPTGSFISYEVTQVATIGDMASSALGLIREDGTIAHRALNNLTKYSFKTTENYIGIKMTNYCKGWKFKDFQIEESSTATSYEPYKSNILSTSEDVVLRGVGDVRDTLDCLTGEVVQNIGEMVLDGSESWQKYRTMSDGSYNFVTNKIDKKAMAQGKIISNNLPVRTEIGKGVGLYLNRDASMLELSFNDLSTVEEVKNYLNNNNATVQYQLATESVKTVDLTTVDQDGQPTKLGTFENVTHVSLESAGLIPEVEMEVATKLLEDTVFTLTDAFNTLYPTASKPVVDGTLYGQTLVNIKGEESNDFTFNGYPKYDFLIPLAKKNTDYLIKYDTTISGGVLAIGFLKDKGSWSKNLEKQPNIGLIRLNSGEYPNYFRIIGEKEQTIALNNLMVIEYQDGMENWDIPYFEGMQSVKMPVLMTTGKNLIDNDKLIDGFIRTDGTISLPDYGNKMTGYIKVKPNTTYSYSTYNIDKTLTGNMLMDLWMYYSDIGTISSVIQTRQQSNSKTTISFTTPSDCKYLRIGSRGLNQEGTYVQLEESSSNTSYEPYKSTTLSTPSDLELRKVGEVQDEVNVMTGEVVERIGEVVLDGSDDEQWQVDAHLPNNYKYLIPLINVYYVQGKIITTVVSDKFPSINNGDSGGGRDIESVCINGWVHGSLNLSISKTKLSNGTINELREYLSQNPITVQYQLATPTIKTVDLSIVNQDGNETKLITFDDTTHVLLQSEAGPNPGASLTVRTKIPSGSSMSLLMNDISTNQQQLEATVDEQSNNVDATMIATTEIYEETL